MEALDGDVFDVSTHVGETFYAVQGGVAYRASDVLKAFNNGMALLGWRKTKETPPPDTADLVLCAAPGQEFFGVPRMGSFVRQSPEAFPLWLYIPPVPAV
jgi:hypothetical protein